jgi:hypothetical protein
VALSVPSPERRACDSLAYMPSERMISELLVANKEGGPLLWVALFLICKKISQGN